MMEIKSDDLFTGYKHSLVPCLLSTMIFGLKRRLCTSKFNSLARGLTFGLMPQPPLSGVNWTDETVLTILSRVGEQNAIDFSSAGGLRDGFAFLNTAVRGRRPERRTGGGVGGWGA